MRFAGIVLTTAVLATAAIAAGASFGARPAAAEVDLTGRWSASYALACSANLTQSNGSVSATVDCGSDIVVDLEGTLNAMNRSISLSGDFTGFPVSVEATLSMDGSLMEGTWSAPPLVDEGPFEGAREGVPQDPSDSSGNWNFSVHNIFSGSCTADILQDGLSVTADVDCDDGPSGAFDGTFDPERNNVSLSGPFGEFQGLDMSLNISEDGSSFNGIWVIAGVGPGGTMDGERLAAPTPTRARATVTPSISTLPETGSGAGGGGTDGWVYAAIATAITFSAASCVVWRRTRRA